MFTRSQSAKRIAGSPRCSFCQRAEPDEAGKLIAGPGVYICVDCVGLCNEIIKEEHLPQPT